MYIKEVSSYPSTEEYYSLLKTIEEIKSINIFKSINLPTIKAKNFFIQLMNNGNIDNFYVTKLGDEFGPSFTGMQVSKTTKLDINKLEEFLIEREKYNKISRETIHNLLLYNLAMYFSNLSIDGSSDEVKAIKIFIKNEFTNDENPININVELRFLKKKERTLKLEYLNKSSISDILEDINELSEDKNITSQIEILKHLLDIEN